MKEWKIDFKYNLKLYFGLIAKYKWVFFSLLFIILLLESSYVADNFLYKVVIDKGTSFSEGNIPKESLISNLWIVAIIFGGIALIRLALKFAHIHLINRLDGSIMRDLKMKFFNHLIGLSHKFHNNEKTGSLISKLIRSGGSVERMTDVLIFSFAPLFFKLIVTTITLFIFSWGSAIITLLTIISFISYSLFIQKKQEGLNLIVNNTDDKEKATIADYFNNIDSIKYFGKSQKVKDHYAKVSAKTKSAQLKHWDVYRFMDAGQSLILAFGIFGIVFISIWDFLNNGATIGSLVFIYATFGGLLGPLFGFMHGIRGFYRSMADFESLFRYAKIDNEVKESPDAKNYKIRKGEIIFNQISFGYGKRKVFKNLNLTVSRGKKVALVGHSGCGKSTLVKLLYRMYDVDKGEILIDNRNIKEYSKEGLRSEMSIVPQECALFDDTMYNNISFSKPNAKRVEVLKAIKFAQLDKIIKNFPDGLNTIVGERGVKLSGGEKQRVSIARAILANKKILVLDEATSALDSQTEHDIQRDLEKLMKGRTSVIIAHRLSTIMKADLIVVMEKGKIIEMATHNELVSKGGQYKKLWDLQKGGFDK